MFFCGGKSSIFFANMTKKNNTQEILRIFAPKLFASSQQHDDAAAATFLIFFDYENLQHRRPLQPCKALHD
jgi:hypothetical protein